MWLVKLNIYSPCFHCSYIHLPFFFFFLIYTRQLFVLPWEKTITILQESFEFLGFPVIHWNAQTQNAHLSLTGNPACDTLEFWSWHLFKMLRWSVRLEFLQTESLRCLWWSCFTQNITTQGCVMDIFCRDSAFLRVSSSSGYWSRTPGSNPVNTCVLVCSVIRPFGHVNLR